MVQRRYLNEIDPGTLPITDNYFIHLVIKLKAKDSNYKNIFLLLQPNICHLLVFHLMARVRILAEGPVWTLEQHP